MLHNSEKRRSALKWKCDFWVNKRALSSSMTGSPEQKEDEHKSHHESESKSSQHWGRQAAWGSHTHGSINHFLTRLSFQSAPDTNPAPPLPPWPAAPRSSSSPPVGSWPGRGTVQRGTPPWRKCTAPVPSPPAAHWSRWAPSSCTRCSFLQEGWQHWSRSNSHGRPTRPGPGSSKWKCSRGGLGE